MISSFINLFFPNLCESCNSALAKGEESICTTCEFELPKTGFERDMVNIVAKKFWGKITVENAMAMYYFNKGGSLQPLIHGLKYGGKTNVGIRLGKLMGWAIKESKNFKEIDLVIPIPLHKTKLRKRGYNQSNFIAEGLSTALNIPYSVDLVKRVVKTSTQTKKSRLARWDNVDGIFAINKMPPSKIKHLLIVDDVLTTGSTLEACAKAVIQKMEDVKISFATIAYAQ